MKALLALPLLLACAVACAGPSTATTPTAAANACGAMVPAVVYKNSQVFAGPDSSHKVLATVNQDTPVCASPDAQAFGFRKVKLADGSTGYVAESSLSI